MPQLAEAYEFETGKAYTRGVEEEIVRLFGKPPYEFLGQTPGRDYPNYIDFAPQYTDDVGREYQRSHEDGRFYVRIPMGLTRRRRHALHSRYEDQVGFPRPGEDLRLQRITTRRAAGAGAPGSPPLPKTIWARVQSCPFDERRAVSNVFFTNMAVSS